MMEVAQKRSKEVKPNLKLVAGLHGDEPLGGELLLRLVLHLVQGFASDHKIRLINPLWF